MSIGRGTHVTFLLGKPIRLSSVIAEVIQRLHRDVSTITMQEPDTRMSFLPSASRVISLSSEVFMWNNWTRWLSWSRPECAASTPH